MPTAITIAASSSGSLGQTPRRLATGRNLADGRRRFFRAVLARLRDEISSGLLDASGLKLALGGVANAIEGQLLQSLSHSLRAVINVGDAKLADLVENYSSDAVKQLKGIKFDRPKLGAKGLPYEKLDQLTMEVLMGVR